MTTQTLWIVVAVVVAVLLIAVALGLVLRRQRRISLRETEQLEREPGPAPPRKGGTYQAESGFSFSSGTAAARPHRSRPPRLPWPRPPGGPPSRRRPLRRWRRHRACPRPQRRRHRPRLPLPRAPPAGCADDPAGCADDPAGDARSGRGCGPHADRARHGRGDRACGGAGAAVPPRPDHPLPTDTAARGRATVAERLGPHPGPAACRRAPHRSTAPRLRRLLPPRRPPHPPHRPRPSTPRKAGSSGCAGGSPARGPGSGRACSACSEPASSTKTRGKTSRRRSCRPTSARR